MITERRAKGATSRTTKRKRKFVPVPKGLCNWPPSRGPMPTAWLKKPAYKIPTPVIVDVLWDPRRRYTPVTPIKVVQYRAPPMPKSSRRAKRWAARKPGRHVYNGWTKESWAEHCERERVIELSLGHHVATCALLTHKTWGLVHGAKLQRPSKRTLAKFKGKMRRALVGGGKPYARLESCLPAREYTFDISYPMSGRIARVTIKPYTTKRHGRPMHDRMSVGYLLYQLARAYKQIYRRWKHYGIWGHAIDDLVFEHLKIENNVGYVSIGS